MSTLLDLFTFDIVRARQRELLADADRMSMRAQAPRPRRPPSALWRVFTRRIHRGQRRRHSHRVARPRSVNAPVRVRTRPR